MKRKVLKISFLCTMLAFASQTNAQVTIGSVDAPATGALLQLKDGTTGSNPLVNASNGLNLPRVELRFLTGDLGQSLNSTVTTTGTLDPTVHIGLTVYHTDKCTLDGNGIYSWTGTKWQKQGDLPPANMHEWAKMAGFTDADIASIPNTGGTLMNGLNPVTKSNGIQLHKDQDGNIFLSGNFGYESPGKERRWMLNNLAANSFAPNGTRTGVDDTVIQDFSTDPGTLPSGATSYIKPQWAFPKDNGETITPGESTQGHYATNPRVGRLYNWAAATNSKGGTSSGQGNDVNEWNDYSDHNRRQGICPNSWHLPSDWEFTELENEIKNNTITYSSRGSNIDGADFANSASTEHRALIAAPMKGECEGPTTGTDRSSSNPINTIVIPGMNYLFAGNAYHSLANNYGQNGYFWTSSSFDNADAWYRVVRLNDGTASHTAVSRYNGGRQIYVSVRCKKDN